jgi:hypothetical protein
MSGKPLIVAFAVMCATLVASCGDQESVELSPTTRMQVKRVMVVEVNTAFNDIWTRTHRADTAGVADLAVRLSLASRQVSALLKAADLPEGSLKTLVKRYADLSAASDKLGVEAGAGDVSAVMRRIKAIRADHCNGCHLTYGYRKI